MFLNIFIFISGCIVFPIFYLMWIVVAFLMLYISFGKKPEHEDYLPFGEKIFIVSLVVLLGAVIVKLFIFGLENFDILKNGYPETIEKDGNTYVLQEPPEQIVYYDKTYILVTEEE